MKSVGRQKSFTVGFYNLGKKLVIQQLGNIVPAMVWRSFQHIRFLGIKMGAKTDIIKRVKKLRICPGAGGARSAISLRHHRFSGKAEPQPTWEDLRRC